MENNILISPQREEEKEDRDENMSVIKQTPPFFDCSYMYKCERYNAKKVFNGDDPNVH